MEKAAGKEDLVFRIGGDEFVILTNSKDITHALGVTDPIVEMNGLPIVYEGQEIPLHLHYGITRFNTDNLKYDELFISLHRTILDIK